jgi:hypothetical protein
VSCAALASSRVVAQTNSRPDLFSLCTQTNALDTVRQQIGNAKTIERPAQRIEILLHVADVLWPYEEERARATFIEAFDIAIQLEKTKGDASANRKSLLLAMERTDERFTVIRAVAKRDALLAKKLIEQALKTDSEARRSPSVTDSFNDVLIGQRLLESATRLVATNVEAALEMAKISLGYPASFMISRFLYSLARIDQHAADRFYEQALAIYRGRPMREFLYLKVYPFGLRADGDMPVFGFYEVPRELVSNPSLQRRFVQILLARAQQALEIPLDEGDNFNDLPGLGHIVQALTAIEPGIRQSLQDLIDDLLVAREKLLVSLPVNSQRVLGSDPNSSSTEQSSSFEQRISAALRVRNIDKRDDLIVAAVLSTSDSETIASVNSAIDKISIASVRAALVEWLYFSRSQKAIRAKQIDEAMELVIKVGAQDLRAYLYLFIAREMLTLAQTQLEGRQMLEEAIAQATAAPKSVVTARVLLTASILYARFDLNRSIAVLADAVTIVNRLEGQDLTNEDLVKEIKYKTFTRQARYYIPGLDPESAFREFAKIDYDDALSATSVFTDKFQRTSATLAVAEVCLRRSRSRVIQPQSPSLK